MAKNFLGTGWRFPILPDPAGGLGYTEDQPNIEQSLRILLLTRLGERMMRPGFGCRVPELLFAPGSLQNLRLLESSVEESVRDWEPRIDLEEVRAEADPDDETRVTVSVAYRVRSTNSRHTLVFPFYLEDTGLVT